MEKGEILERGGGESRMSFFVLFYTSYFYAIFFKMRIFHKKYAN